MNYDGIDRYGKSKAENKYESDSGKSKKITAKNTGWL